MTGEVSSDHGGGGHVAWATVVLSYWTSYHTCPLGFTGWRSRIGGLKTFG
jgi:hypothetical protein